MANHSKKQIIEDNLDNIEQWAAEGLPLSKIAEKLGIGAATLYRHKAVNEKMQKMVKAGRKEAVGTLEDSMFRSATGYTQTVKKYAKLKHCEYENGKKLREWEEMVEYEEVEIVKPDITAGIFLLKNWGNYMNEPRAMELRKKELRLKKQQVENQTW